MAKSNPSDFLGEFGDEFADEDSPEFHRARASIPTRPEIDALFADDPMEVPYRSGPREAASNDLLFGRTDSSPVHDTDIGSSDPAEPAGSSGIRTGWQRRPRRGLARRAMDALHALAERIRRVRMPARRPRSSAGPQPRPVLERTPDTLPNVRATRPQILSAARRGAAVAARALAGLAAAARWRPARSRTEGPASWAHVIAATVLLSVGAFFLVLKLGSLMSAGPNAAAADGDGSLTVMTEPAGARVLIDGTEHGVTPATLPVPAGEHILEVRTGDISKTMPLTVAAGERLERTFDLKTRAVPGRLEVQSSPAGAQVFVDGRHRGRAPLTLTDLNPGQHTVLVQRGTQSAQQVVDIEAGGTFSVSLSLAESTAATTGRSAGVLAIRAPMELEVFEFGRSLGTTRAGRLELPAGRRELEFVNDAYAVRVRQKVDVAGGRTTTLTLEIPPGVVTINAIPWADVRLDGRTIGRTPVADLKVEAGRHDVVLHHPRFGQRRLTITVSAGAPLVVTTDLTK